MKKEELEAEPQFVIVEPTYHTFLSKKSLSGAWIWGSRESAMVFKYQAKAFEVNAGLVKPGKVYNLETKNPVIDPAVILKDRFRIAAFQPNGIRQIMKSDGITYLTLNEAKDQLRRIKNRIDNKLTWRVEVIGD